MHVARFVDQQAVFSKSLVAAEPTPGGIASFAFSPTVSSLQSAPTFHPHPAPVEPWLPDTNDPFLANLLHPALSSSTSIQHKTQQEMLFDDPLALDAPPLTPASGAADAGMSQAEFEEMMRSFLGEGA